MGRLLAIDLIYLKQYTSIDIYVDEIWGKVPQNQPKEFGKGSQIVAIVECDVDQAVCWFSFDKVKITIKFV